MPPLTLADRCALYTAAWGHPLYVENGRISGTWLIGNDYRATGTIRGSYPPSYQERVLSMFPGWPEMLHLFSGSIEPGPWVRVDNHAEDADWCDAEHLPTEWEGRFALTLADPPYSNDDAHKMYDCKMPRRNIVLHELARCTQPDGWCVWLDTQWPICRCGQNNPEADWHWRGHIALVRSQGHRVRLVSLFQRR